MEIKKAEIKDLDRSQNENGNVYRSGFSIFFTR